MTGAKKGGRGALAPSTKAALSEFLVVGGASLAVIFWIIPWQTSSGGTEIGLSPRLLPTVSAAAIGLLALIRFICVLAKPTGVPSEEAPPIRFALAIMVMSVAGILVIRYFGWPPGGAVLSLLVILVLGERRPLRLVAVPLSVALLLFLIQQTGI